MRHSGRTGALPAWSLENDVVRRKRTARWRRVVSVQPRVALPQRVELAAEAAHEIGVAADDEIFVVALARAARPVEAAVGQLLRIEQRELVVHVRRAAVETDFDAGLRQLRDIAAGIEALVVVADDAHANAAPVRV